MPHHEPGIEVKKEVKNELRGTALLSNEPVSAEAKSRSHLECRKALTVEKQGRKCPFRDTGHVMVPRSGHANRFAVISPTSFNSFRRETLASGGPIANGARVHSEKRPLLLPVESIAASVRGPRCWRTPGCVRMACIFGPKGHMLLETCRAPRRKLPRVIATVAPGRRDQARLQTSQR